MLGIIKSIKTKFYAKVLMVNIGVFLAMFLAGFGLSNQALAKDDLVMSVTLEPPHLDPTAGAAAAIDEITYANIFEGLTRLSPQGQVLPGLAKSWQISERGLVFTFELRDNVVFHNGKKFTADDVKFSLDRARGEGSTNAQKALFEPIEDVTILGPHKVEIRLKRATGNFLFNLSWGDAVIVDSQSVETNRTKPIGTGAFRFVEWVRGDHIEITRFHDYWGVPAKLEKVKFRFIQDPAAMTAALFAGDVDAFPNFGAQENLEAIRENGNYDVVIGSTEGETILAMNHKNPYLAKKEVRRAIAKAIDRQTLIDIAMSGSGTPIGSHFPPHHNAYVDLTDRSAYDPVAAKKILADAGIAAGEIRLRLFLPPPPYARRGGEIIAAFLAEIGIETTIIPVEWAVWLDQVFKRRDYDLTIVAHTEPMDIDIYARDDYYFNYNHSSFNAIIEKLKAESDAAKRNDLFKQAQRILADDYANGFLFQLPKVGVWKKGLKGLWVNAPMQANDLTGVYWE